LLGDFVVHDDVFEHVASDETVMIYVDWIKGLLFAFPFTSGDFPIMI